MDTPFDLECSTAAVLTRRQCLERLLGLATAFGMSNQALAMVANDASNPFAPDALPPEVALDARQVQAVRQWIQLIVAQQLNQGPTPRWEQHDCVGLVRFACAEALRSHDEKWLRANGFKGRRLPPEPNLSDAQLAAIRHEWRRADGQRGAYVSALELVQYNCRLVGRDLINALPADLLLFDQGQAQHLMIWMGQYVAYHTGTVTKTDNGLRAYPLEKLINWKDTRWQPQAQNPNFLGLYRLAFLSPNQA
ncbi:DUF1175 family protein [Aquirhabdus sp.]|uniref:DUF1175 family protein n=1 Tax=Aquirhabdus sp. TaxID=2824160 RepID=UPI00396C5D85